MTCAPIRKLMPESPELESSMTSVQIEQKSYEMPPRDGFTVSYFLTVADVERSLCFYEKVFGGRILSRGDSRRAWLHPDREYMVIVNVGRAAPEKPSVTLSVPDRIRSALLDIRVADIEACYELWRSREPSSSPSRRKVRRDALLHPRSRWLYDRGRTEQAGLHVRLAPAESDEDIISYRRRGSS